MAMHKSNFVAVALLLLSIHANSARGQGEIAKNTLAINDIQIYYEEVGAGPPLLLLHDFGGCTQSWQTHVGALAKQYRVIIPDLRGHGRSTNPSGKFTHRQAAFDVFALLDELGIQRVQAMGMSSGGMTLIHMATQQPERIEAMVLIGATVYFPDQARAIMRKSHSDSMSAREWEEWAQCSSRGNEQTREIVGIFHRFKDSYDDMNFTAPYLSTITAKTLIVHGDRDEFFPVSIAAQMYEAIPNAYLWIIPNGTHIPIFGDRAEAFQNNSLKFLSGGWMPSGH
jgi:pimeloyl-ACP methyl ester carboxylesterase